jgi:hypothetical protein
MVQNGLSSLELYSNVSMLQHQLLKDKVVPLEWSFNVSAQ